MNVMLGKCDHEIRVTHLKGKGWGIRLYTNGLLNQEQIVDDRADIAHECKMMLRMEDKCGNKSQYAASARHRNKPV